MSSEKWKAAAQDVVRERTVVEMWNETKPTEGKRAARVYLAAQLQATCMQPDMAGPRGVRMLEDAVDACPE
eukprot:COSAG02_NODE_16266_length_1098_cov_1.068068_1_plen_70_part_10